MAKKKRRRRRSMSKGSHVMSARRRKRGTRRRRRGLSEAAAFSKTSVERGAMATVSGLAGGALASLLNRFEMPGLARFTFNLGTSFVISSFMKAPETGAGVAGAYGMLLMQQLAAGGTLTDHAPFADEDVLEKYPMFLDENGREMYLAQDNELYYLEENDDNDYVDPRDELMSQNEMYLEENIYPAYVNPAEY